MFQPGISQLVHAAGLVRTACARPDARDVVLMLRESGYAMTARRLFSDLHAKVRFVIGGALPPPPPGVDTEVVDVPCFRRACCYAPHDLPRRACVDAFDVARNEEAEKKLLQRVRRHVGTTFVVVHDDESRRIKKDMLPEGLPVVSVRDPRWRTPCIFDWAATINHAVQFHGIDSCFLRMAHIMGLKARKYCHAYADRQAPHAALAAPASSSAVIAAAGDVSDSRGTLSTRRLWARPQRPSPSKPPSPVSRSPSSNSPISRSMSKMCSSETPPQLGSETENMNGSPVSHRTSSPSQKGVLPSDRVGGGGGPVVVLL